MKKKKSSSFHINTRLAHDDKTHSERAVVPPIYQNSLFTMDSWDHADQLFNDKINNHIYSRVTNPSVSAAEEKLAILANAEKAKLFSSGMAAISAAILSNIRRGSHIITINNIYGPARNFLESYLRPKFDIDISFVDGTDVNNFTKAVKDTTDLIYLESPSSVVFSLQDLEAISIFAKKKKFTTVIDNTWATPLYQKPLDLGIDLEVHSCTKYLGGHSDIVAGVVMGSSERINSLLSKEYELLGPKMAPFEAWLLLRSLRTFPLRMQQHQNTALKVSEYLHNHPKISKVNYPGLKSFSQYELGKKQMTGYSGLLSFKLKSDNLEKIKLFFNSLELFQIGVSWGGHESLIFSPAISYLKELKPNQFEALGISLGDMRISVGLEHHKDLIADLDQALDLI